MKKIEIKNRYTGEVIYSHECEGNNIKITVEKAVREDANLSSANLSSADLRSANLRNADLRNADLRNANLSSADLWSANLRNANLSSADLRNANLSSADLRNADLRNAKNKDEAVKVPMYCKWAHGVTNGSLIHIGCEKRNIEEWDKFFSSNEEIDTKRNTPEFKQIQAVYEAYKAYLIFLTE